MHPILPPPPHTHIDFRTKLESKEVTFAELASKESDCSSARKGGDLGVFGPNQMQSECLIILPSGAAMWALIHSTHVFLYCSTCI